MKRKGIGQNTCVKVGMLLLRGCWLPPHFFSELRILKELGAEITEVRILTDLDRSLAECFAAGGDDGRRERESKLA
jgi:hypothetical protein